MSEKVFEKIKTLTIDCIPLSSTSPNPPIAGAASSSKLNAIAPAFVPRSRAASPPPASSAPPEPVDSNRIGRAVRIRKAEATINEEEGHDQLEDGADRPVQISEERRRTGPVVRSSEEGGRTGRTREDGQLTGWLRRTGRMVRTGGITTANPLAASKQNIKNQLTNAVLTHMDDGYLADDEGDDDDDHDDDEDDEDHDENNEANQQADEDELGAGEVINDDAPMDVDPVLNLNDTRTIVVIGPVASRTADLIAHFIFFCDPVHRLENGSYLVGFHNVVLLIVEFNDPEMNLPADIQPDGFVLCHNVNLPLDVGTLHQWINAARMRSFDDAYIVLYGTDTWGIEVGSVAEQNLVVFSFMIHRCRYFSANVFEEIVGYPPPADAFNHLMNSL